MGDQATNPFVTLTFDGGRFEGHESPVDVLAGVVALQDAIAYVAVEKFCQELKASGQEPSQADRASVRDACKLYLREVRHNCFTGDFVSRPKQPFSALVEYGRDTVMGALEGNGGARLPKPVVRKLGRFANSFRPGESLRVRYAERAFRVDYSQLSSLSIKTTRPSDKGIQGVILGEVTMLRDNGYKATVNDDRVGEVRIAFQDIHRKALTEAYLDRPLKLIEVSGLLRRTTRGHTMTKLLSVTTTGHPRLAEMEEAHRRVDAIVKDVEGDGWGDVTPEAAALTKTLVSKILATFSWISRPGIFPRDGGTQLEWHNDVLDVELRVDSSASVIKVTRQELVGDADPEEWDIHASSLGAGNLLTMLSCISELATTGGSHV